MASSIPADLIDEVQARCRERIPELLKELILRMQRSDGTTYGDVNLTPAQRVARFYYYAQNGTLDALQTVRPDLLDRMVKQYHADIQLAPFSKAPAPVPPVPMVPPAPPLMPAPGVPPVPSIPQMAA